MKVYDQYEVLSISESDGLVHVKWFSKGDKSNCLIRPHYVPLECELERWSEKELFDFWRQDIPDVPAIPTFLTKMVKTISR